MSTNLEVVPTIVIKVLHVKDSFHVIEKTLYLGSSRSQGVTSDVITLIKNIIPIN